MKNELKEMAMHVEAIAKKLTLISRRANAGTSQVKFLPVIDDSAQMSDELLHLVDEIDWVIDSYFGPKPEMGSRPF